MKRFLAIVFALATGGCYAHGPKPPPCVNVENCGNPGDLPPLTDSKKSTDSKKDGRR